MAWTSMHFAVGMMCGGAAAGAIAIVWRRGMRWLPLAMTLGGFWALVPDLPRIFREDFPSLPFAATLGDRQLEAWLHSIGDIFFFHHALDAQPHEFALHGLAIIILLYNVALVGLMLDGRRGRDLLSRWRRSRMARARAAVRTRAMTLVGCEEEAGEPVVARIRSSHLQRSA